MSDFYSQNDYRDYLQHHGIKGMHWGEQNGPPYPLSTKMHNMVVRNKQKRAEKRREKILHDPRKLSKHASEFSKEEIDAAVEKIDSINQAKRRITPNKREKAQANREAAKLTAQMNKDRAKQQKKADDKMTKKIEKYAPNVTALEQNIKKFNQQELEEALRRLNNKDRMFETKMNRLNRPKKFLDIGVGYLDTIKRGIEAVTGLEKAMGLENPNKLSYDELHNEFLGKMYESGKISKYALSDKNWKTLKSESDIKTKEKKAKKEWNREEEKADAAVKEAKAKANLYQAKADEIAWNMARARIDEVPQAATENFFTGTYYQDDNGHWQRRDPRSFAMSDIDEILSVRFSDIDKDFFLAHHGIKGQMWGVRNGPPYPLDAKTHARVKKQKNATVGIFEDFANAVSDVKLSNYKGISTAYDTDWDGWMTQIHKTGKFSPAKKISQEVTGYRPFGGTMQPIWSEKITKTDDIEEWKSDVSLFSKRKPVINPLYLSDDSNFVTDKMRKINPGWNSTDETAVWGTRNNCAKCAATMTLMKMGYNNIQAGRLANGKAPGSSSMSSAYWFKGGTHKKTNDLDDIRDAIKQAKPGSFGTIGMGRLNAKNERASGHAFSWTKTRSGKIRIEDPQTGKVYDSLDDYIKLQNFSSGTLATFSDLTNATPKWDAMEQDGVFGIAGNNNISPTNRMTVDPLETNFGNNIRKWNQARPNISSSNAYSVFNTPMSSVDSRLDELWKDL